MRDVGYDASAEVVRKKILMVPERVRPFVAGLLQETTDAVVKAVAEKAYKDGYADGYIDAVNETGYDDERGE